MPITVTAQRYDEMAAGRKANYLWVLPKDNDKRIVDSPGQHPAFSAGPFLNGSSGLQVAVLLLEKDLEPVLSRVAALEAELANATAKIASQQQKIESIATQEKQFSDQRLTIEALKESVAAHEKQSSDQRQKIEALEVSTAKQDQQVLALQHGAKQQELETRTLEARLFVQSALEIKLSKTLSEQEAELQKHRDNVSAIEAAASNGAKGLDGAISAGKADAQAAALKITDLQSQIAALADSKAELMADMEDGFTPLETVVNKMGEDPLNSVLRSHVDASCKALENKILAKIIDTTKQPLDGRLGHIVGMISELKEIITQP